MNITMEGKWAYRKEPTKQVRILCVDRPHATHPIVSMGEKGLILHHQKNGWYYRSREGDYDLIPLEEPPVEVWLKRLKTPCGLQDKGFLVHSEKGFKGDKYYTPAKLFREVKE